MKVGDLVRFRANPAYPILEDSYVGFIGVIVKELPFNPYNGIKWFSVLWTDGELEPFPESDLEVINEV